MSELTPAPKGYAIKLVRDDTPRIINGSGQPGGLFYREVASYEERSKWLRRKLIEEAAEYLESGEIEELADALAVIEGLAWASHGMTLRELGDRMHADPRGGFLRGQMMYGHHPEFDG